MQHINGRYPRYCCRSLGEQGGINQRNPEQISTPKRKLRLHLDKVIGHQGRRGKNCTRKGREEKKKVANWPFLCVKGSEH